MDTRAVKSYQSQYLNHNDLLGRIANVKISRVEIKVLARPPSYNERHERIVIFFEGKNKGLILSKTRLRQLWELFGSESDDWVNKQIRLAPGRASNNRDTIDILGIDEIEQENSV